MGTDGQRAKPSSKQPGNRNTSTHESFLRLSTYEGETSRIAALRNPRLHRILATGVLNEAAKVRTTLEGRGGVGDMRVLTVAALFLAISAAASGQAGEPKTSQDRASQMEQSRDSASQSGTGPAKPSDNDRTDVAVPQILPDVPRPPAWVTYRFFFLHVANLDKVAAQEEANGKEGEKWRTHDQRVARLSEEEGKIVRQEAHDCNQEVSDMDAKIQAEASTFRTQNPTGQDHNILLPPELESRWQQRIQIINSHIDQLRLMLGEDSFQKLDSYVHREFEPIVMTVPGAPVLPAKDKPLGDIQ